VSKENLQKKVEFQKSNLKTSKIGHEQKDKLVAVASYVMKTQKTMALLT